MDALPTRFAIRSALDKDLPSLPGIESAADEVFREHGIGPLPPPADVEAYRSAVFVLVAGDPPIGFVRVVEIDGEAHLEQLSVIPTQTRKGVGGQLLRACIDSARARGFARLTLITFADLAWNGKFYLDRGFKPLSELTPGLERLRERELLLGLDQLGTRIVLALGLVENSRQ
jgi:GNAT superfamily N-acetyltransferase